MIVIADTSPLNYLIQIECESLLPQLYNRVVIPEAVRLELRHPFAPRIVRGWAENLPIQYQSNEVPNVAEIKTRQDYYQIDWPIVTRQRQVGVYAEEVLAVYAPFAMGVICNIANG